MNRKQRRAAAKSGQSPLGIQPPGANPAQAAVMLLAQGVRHQREERLRDAELSFKRAIDTDPQCADAHHLLGILLHRTGRTEQGLKLIHHAIEQDRKNPLYYSDLGNVLQQAGQTGKAIECFDTALSLSPNFPDAYNNKGIALFEQGSYREALDSYTRAVALRPNFADALSNMANAHLVLGQLDEAVTCYERSLAINGANANAWAGLGSALSMKERFEEAVPVLEKALELRPGLPQALHELAFAIARLCDWNRRPKLNRELSAKALPSKSPGSPAFAVWLTSDKNLQLRLAKLYAAEKYRHMPVLERSRPLQRREKIRLAYLSADFQDHPVSRVLVELIERHDRSKFEVVALSSGADNNSSLRPRLQQAFDRFIDIREMDDGQAAQIISEADIAIDLMGYTSRNRLEILARRPCPVQTAYLGYPGTTGTNFIDYVLGDEIVTPADHSSFYTEKIVQLPDCFFPRDSTKEVPQAPGKADAGLPPDAFVFCAFNQSVKITPEIFGIWMRLLTQVEGSVLWLNAHAAESNLRSHAAAHGVDPSRLIFAPFVRTVEDHLARQQLADLFLDTVPYNAHSTASDALYAGVPIVTIRGETFAGRVGASLLTALGLPELITHSPDGYEALALQLARDPDLLCSYKRQLAVNRLSHPLFDTGRLCRNIEAAFVEMWETCQRGEAPRSFRVDGGGACMPCL